jgi:hypothetical protein
MKEGEGVVSAQVELQAIRKLRKKKLPYLRQRIPKLYSALSS